MTGYKVSQEIIRFHSRLKEFTVNYTSSDRAMEVRHRWEELLPRGGGTVRIDEHDKYEYLGEPIRDQDEDRGPLY
ncbi:hypothetical protein DM02DRAFT_664128 [Periconia macrospinosa]|uniref:Uncharacterized protein n=1 Tax=Periconia macrospinosa TaxID=97972 RepID=A0A2V1D116_9PLEO|nr:hypothetical protein DM02DRAFT_664128 [Periconia macrospinosa]